MAKEGLDTRKRATQIHKDYVEEVGRNPTESLVDFLGNRLSKESSKNMKVEGLSATDFNSVVSSLQQTYGVTVEKVSELVQEFAGNISTADKEVKKKMLARKGRLTKLAGWAAICAGLGMVGGSFMATHHLLVESHYDPLVTSLQEELQAEYAGMRAELDEYRDMKDAEVAALRQSFYDGLETLTEKPALRASALYLAGNFGTLYQGYGEDSGQTIYDNVIDGLRVTAVKSMSILTVSKGDAKTGRELAVFRYRTDQRPKTGTYANYFRMDKLFKNVKPLDSVIATGGTEVTHIVHGKSLEVTGGDKVYRSPDTSVYDEQATKILDEFRKLYKRGPNPNEK